MQRVAEGRAAIAESQTDTDVGQHAARLAAVGVAPQCTPGVREDGATHINEPKRIPIGKKPLLKGEQLDRSRALDINDRIGSEGKQIASLAPVLLGITMWLTFKLNPTATDPVQAQMFAIMPWILMFVMAPFAAGLLLYWVTSNLLTLAQQSYLYSKHPQLKAQADKDQTDVNRVVTREQKAASTRKPKAP